MEIFALSLASFNFTRRSQAKREPRDEQDGDNCDGDPHVPILASLEMNEEVYARFSER